MKRAFTLVELLIVIALIAILSVAVLATINPIEQSNKAKDSTVQNDAAEVMNAYERYYTVKFSYPWVDVSTIDALSSTDAAWFGASDRAGAALCTGAAGVLPGDRCTTYNNGGLLISTDELKDSFLAKGYTSIAADDPNYNLDGFNYLYIDKKDSATGHNSIYVCYIPKAKSNRTSTTTLYTPTVVAGAVTALTKASPSDAAVFTNGYPNKTNYDFLTLEKSLFKCVP